jgi:fluoride ion exporter CrcB/FEX
MIGLDSNPIANLIMVLIVAFFGVGGAALRFGCLSLNRHFRIYPIGTLISNLLGVSIGMGSLMIFEHFISEPSGSLLLAALTSGLAGGCSTLSAVIAETVDLINRKLYRASAIYMFLSVASPVVVVAIFWLV